MKCGYGMWPEIRHCLLQQHKPDSSVISIYNSRIFFTKDPAAWWDGTYKVEEQDCNPGVYKKGTIVLVR